MAYFTQMEKSKTSWLIFFTQFVICIVLILFYFHSLITETALLITLDLSQLKLQGVKDDRINYVYRSNAQGTCSLIIFNIFFMLKFWHFHTHLLKNLFLTSQFFTEWHRCQTQVWKKSITDLGIFQSQERELWIEGIPWSLEEVDQTQVLLVQTPGRCSFFSREKDDKICENFLSSSTEKSFWCFPFSCENESFGCFLFHHFIILRKVGRKNKICSWIFERIKSCRH